MDRLVFSDSFVSASVILPVMTETASLLETYRLIEESSHQNIREYIIVVSSKTAAPSLAACHSLIDRDPTRIRLHQQSQPFLGGALREAFALAQGSHVIMMASDLETDPRDVPTMIAAAKADPNCIFTASRWLRGGGFRGYNPVKLILNLVFQNLFAILYRRRLSDMTYGYRIFPTPLVKAIKWEELRHPFLFETILKPIRLGVRVKEFPSGWQQRVEGQSQNTFMRNFEYLYVGARMLRYRPKDILIS